MKLNTFEAVGIFGSIAVMTLALAIVRFEPSIFNKNAENTESEGAVVVATKEENKSAGLEKALKDAHTTDGTLVKLVVEDVREGTGDVAVKTGDTLVVQYIGTTQDGKKFDSSYDRGEAFIFTIGKGTVIKGWEEGLIGMKVGGHRVLVIPSDMAYGNRQVGVIAPNTPLVFAVELIEIR
jgi:peptidylprolyl isomerase